LQQNVEVISELTVIIIGKMIANVIPIIIFMSYTNYRKSASERPATASITELFQLVLNTVRFDIVTDANGQPVVVAEGHRGRGVWHFLTFFI